jgi:UDP-glucuronate 4-epimerase
VDRRNLVDRILVTGAAGFIGFHLSKSLLDDGFEVLGIDNLNDYYDPNLKLARLEQLNPYKNFTFDKIDISDRKSLTKAFTDFKPKKVVNLAAQAGVRYSIENPYAYMNSNLVGFLNIIELCRHNNVKGLIYASSSSVYGGNTKIPFSAEDRVDNPISLYAASKKSNELIANAYSHLYGLHTTGLRYFTVYGPWGRPDMAMFIFTNKILVGEPIPVFNNGNMKRDFTYIDDIICGTRAAIDKNYKCEVFNLGNHKSEQLMDVVGLIERNLGKKAEINFLPIQPGDAPESFADINKSVEMLHFKPTTNVDVGINRFIDWYKEFYPLVMN